MSKQAMNIKAAIVRLMHEYMKNINDEDVYMIWAEVGMPDGGKLSDAEYFATNDGEFKAITELFLKCVKMGEDDTVDDLSFKEIAELIEDEAEEMSV